MFNTPENLLAGISGVLGIPSTPLTPYTPDAPLTPPSDYPQWFPRGGTYLIETRQVTQMSYAALYKHVALFAVTIYTYVHT